MSSLWIWLLIVRIFTIEHPDQFVAEVKLDVYSWATEIHLMLQFLKLMVLNTFWSFYELVSSLGGIWSWTHWKSWILKIRTTFQQHFQWKKKSGWIGKFLKRNGSKKLQRKKKVKVGATTAQLLSHGAYYVFSWF